MPRPGIPGLLLLLLSGCAMPGSPTMATVPHEWRATNPWGPQANEARAEGRLVPLFYPKRQAEWEAFARSTIQDGDLLFRFGTAYSLRQQFTSRLIRGVSDGLFSHDGIAKWEGETLYVYDTVPAPEGVRKTPFIFWMLDVDDNGLFIKRVKPEYRDAIPQALAYIEDAYERQVPFDADLHLDDEKLYCDEMLEKAYRSAGLVLSDPVPARCLPHFKRYLLIALLAELFTTIDVEEPIFAIGNEHYGTFGSPCLDLVFAGKVDRHRSGPKCPAVPYPPR